MEESGIDEFNAAINGTASHPLLVIAKFDFNGQNNDEISFRKNDVLTVLQCLDGGWWEGTTADGKIGWFPSNFVGIVNTGRDDIKQKSRENTVDPSVLSNYEKNRKEILAAFISEERDHVATIEEIYKRVNSEIGANKQISPKEALILGSNILELFEFSKNLLEKFRSVSRDDIMQQCFGKLFMDAAPEFYSLLSSYCANYGDAIQILKTKRTSNGQPDDLFIKLSLIYRHVDKYAKVLQEIERNTPLLHPDRGNLQRSCSVYCDFYTFCEDIRKQKEAQHEFLSTGVMESVFGPNFTENLGSFLFIGKIALELKPSASGDTFFNSEKTVDRCIAIFEKLIAFFQLNSENNYQLRGKLSTTGLVVHRTGDLTYEILKADKCQAIFRTYTTDVFEKIHSSLLKCTGIVLADPVTSKKSNTDFLVNSIEKPTAHVEPSCSLQLDHEHGMVLPLPDESDSATNQRADYQSYPNTTELGDDGLVNHRVKLYSGWSLRPFAPTRPELAGGSNGVVAVKMRKNNVVLDEYAEDDALMLKIVEGYCTHQNSAILSYSSNERNSSCCSRHHCIERHSTDGMAIKRAASYPSEETRPQLIVAEDEKLLVEEMEGDNLVVKERTLIDTIYSLRDQLTTLQKARRRLEEQLRQQNSKNSPPASQTNANNSKSITP